MTIDNTPALISLAGNPVRFGITSTHHIETSGVKALVDLVVSGVDTTVGHTMTISFSSFDLEFTLAADPLDDDGLQLPVAVGGDTYSTWAAKLYTALMNNYDLRTNYDISLGGAAPSSRTISFAAKQYGVEWSISIDKDTVTSVAESGETAGRDISYRDSTGVLGMLWDENYDKIGQDFKVQDTDGKCWFDFADFLLSWLQMDTTDRFTSPMSRGVAEYDNYVLKYLASFADDEGGSVRRIYDDTAWRYAMLGGLSRERAVHLIETSTDHFTDKPKQFLSWRPTATRAATDTILKLYFLLLPSDTYSQYAVKCIIYYDDDTEEEFNVSELAAINDYDVVEIPAGYDLLNLGTYAGSKTVLSWSVWVVNESNVPLSDEMEFVLDTRIFEQERQFFFRNSLGAYDTIRCTGLREQMGEYDRAGSMFITEEEWSETNAPARTFRVDESLTHKISTGWISSGEMDWARELLLSVEVYEIDGNDLIPVIIDSKKASLFKDKENLYALEFEYMRAYRDEYYSEDESSQSL